MAAESIRTAAQHFVQPAAWAESQFPVMVPSLVHSTRLAPLPTNGQLGALQAPAAHVKSHWQALAHNRVSHASVPEQFTVHVELVLQVMSLHALAPVQLIVHDQPGGQVTLPQLSALVHSAVQVFMTSSQVVQSLGQVGMTQ